MFSLIITVISIALVAALALATLYYGGAAFNKGSADAEAAKILLQGQQLLGAADLYRADHNEWPHQIQDLVDQGYLKTIPMAREALGSAHAQAVAWTMVDDQPIFMLSGSVQRDACAAVNRKTWLGQYGILLQAYPELMSQCFGSTTYTVLMKKESSSVSLASAGLASGQIGTQTLADAVQVADNWDLAPTAPVVGIGGGSGGSGGGSGGDGPGEGSGGEPPAITVTLGTTSLPDATTNVAYSFDFSTLLDIANDPEEDLTATTWNVLDVSALPAGLTLDPVTGVLSGTPTAPADGAEFTVMAAYKDVQGQQVYTLRIGEVVLYVTQISAGVGHTCAVTVDGGAKCWGQNGSGQLGDGTRSVRYVPVDVAGLTSGVAHISAGSSHTCAVTTAGAAKCWGSNTYHRLGNGGIDSLQLDSLYLTPQDVVGLSGGVSSIEAFGSASCALMTSGSVKCWGYNAHGQVGDGSSTANGPRVAAPSDVVGLSNVVHLSAGGESVCAITSEASAYCWGDNWYGQLGDGTTTNRNTPVPVLNLGPVASIDVGSQNVCAVTTGGGAKCWGHNGSGQIGNGGAYATNMTFRSPQDVLGLSSGVASISVATGQVCASTTAGAAKCWGHGAFGRLGVGNTNTYSAPQDVVGLGAGVASVSAGEYVTCAKMTSGAAKCWGNAAQGLGSGATSGNVLTPVNVLPQ